MKQVSLFSKKPLKVISNETSDVAAETFSIVDGVSNKGSKVAPVLSKMNGVFGPFMTVATDEGQLSLTIGIGTVTFAPHTPGSLSWVISPGQVIAGGVVSTLVTVAPIDDEGGVAVYFLARIQSICIEPEPEEIPPMFSFKFSSLACSVSVEVINPTVGNSPNIFPVSCQVKDQIPDALVYVTTGDAQLWPVQNPPLGPVLDIRTCVPPPCKHCITFCSGFLCPIYSRPIARSTIYLGFSSKDFAYGKCCVRD